MVMSFAVLWWNVKGVLGDIGEGCSQLRNQAIHHNY